MAPSMCQTREEIINYIGQHPCQSDVWSAITEK
jgi:hypothetical protein